MNEFAVISPTYPDPETREAVAPVPGNASPKNLSVNGTASEYCRWHAPYRARFEGRRLNFGIA